AHATVVFVVLFGLSADRLGLNGVWDGGMDLAVSVLAIAFVVGAGPVEGAASAELGLGRGARLWYSYTSGRSRPRGAPALSAKVVALGFGLSAAGFATLALYLGSPVACPETCLVPTPPGSAIAGFTAALVGGILPIAAASDRRMSGIVLVGLGVNGLATLLWIPSWTDPGWLFPEGAGFAFLWLLQLTAIFYLVLRPMPGRPPTDRSPPSA
ncbi:MAG: hypothetical protein L3J73_04605, partial [Thermoplasmata archaeon]|nr:hypothetical protein [Thermoplasmata archaeon]